MSNRIVLIEDEAPFRKVLEKLLKESGYKIISCESATEALREVKKNTPDLIISDYNLEKFSNGVDLGRGIRQSMKLDIPVIIMSGIEQNQSHADANSFMFLKKPFEFEELNQAIQRCLRSARASKKDPRKSGTVVLASHQV